MKHIYDIKAGTLSLKTAEERTTLDRILTFACRENPKRHFILVNKLIGRYTPTAPKVMRQTYNELAEKIGTTSYLIDTAEDIQPEWLTNIAKIGVTAGASAPEILVNQVIEALKVNGGKEVVEYPGRAENTVFAVPLELR